MERLIQDLRYSFRMFRKSPASILAALFSMALAIGANTTVFSCINAALLTALPYRNPDRIALVWGKTLAPDNYSLRNQVSATDIADMRAQNTVFEELSIYTGWMPILSGAGEAERISAIQVGDGYFKVLGGKPMLGRVFRPEEQQEGKDFVIVLGYGLWQKRFGGDPHIVGKSVLLSGRSYVIVGVMPRDFAPLPASLVSPVGEFYRPVAEPYDDKKRDEHHLRAIARLKPGVALTRAEAELDGIAKRLERLHPETNTDEGIHVVSLTDDIVGEIRPVLLMLFGAVTFVLLIACANIGNLLLARSTARLKEIALRSAIGAPRGRIIRQLLTESLLLSLSGGLLGFLMTFWGRDLVQSFASSVLPLLQTIDINFRVFVYAFGISVLTGILFGLAPALKLSGTDLTGSLKEGSGGMDAFAHNSLRKTLVVSEVAVTLMLLMSAGLLIQTVIRLGRVDPGFKSVNLLTMSIGLPPIKYPDPPNWISFYRQALEKIDKIPGVESVASVSVLPMSDNFDGRGMMVEDFPKPRGQEISVDMYVASPHYLETMRIRVLKGRALNVHDQENSPPVVLINQTMANQLWPNASPIGKRIKFPRSDGDPQPWRTIVGVVHDVSQYGLDRTPPMQMYLPHSQVPTSYNTIVVRTPVAPGVMMASVRKAIQAVDKDQAVFNITTMDELLSKSVSLRKFLMLLLVLFAALALSLATIGIYSVLSYSVTRRTREIGVRMAFGALRKDVLKMVVRQGMALVIVGIFVGTAGSLALSRLIRRLLFEVQPSDPLTLILVSVVIAGAALAACLIPAYRATRIDPIAALHHE